MSPVKPSVFNGSKRQGDGSNSICRHRLQIVWPRPHAHLRRLATLFPARASSLLFFLFRTSAAAKPVAPRTRRSLLRSGAEGRTGGCPTIIDYNSSRLRRALSNSGYRSKAERNHWAACSLSPMILAIPPARFSISATVLASASCHLA